MATIEEAQERGYLKAKRIRPAHVDEIITIPADVILFQKLDGNIYLKNSKGVHSFANDKGFTYLSMIYNNYDNKWATIVESWPEECPKLTKFPHEGVCWNPTPELVKFIKYRPMTRALPSLETYTEGIAWGEGTCWGVSASSGKPEYTVEQLKPFLNTPKEPSKIGLDFMTRPTTDNFEIGKTYYVRESSHHNSFMITKCEGYHSNDKDRINGPYLSNMNGNFKFMAKETPWINSGREVCLASVEGTNWLEACIQNNRFIEAEEAKRYFDLIPEYIKHYPMIPEDCYYPLPDKWCIAVDRINQPLLQEFLERKSHEWLHYMPSWVVNPGDIKTNYFHYPPATNEPCHSHWKIQKGYTEITTEQFKQFYNSNSNSNVKQERSISRTSTNGPSDSRGSETSSIKIRTADLQIRQCGEIRATSFRCPKSKIHLRG